MSSNFIDWFRLEQIDKTVAGLRGMMDEENRKVGYGGAAYEHHARNATHLLNAIEIIMRAQEKPEVDLCPTCKAPIRWREDGEWLAGDCYCGHPSAMMAKPRTAKPEPKPEPKPQGIPE